MINKIQIQKGKSISVLGLEIRSESMRAACDLEKILSASIIYYYIYYYINQLLQRLLFHTFFDTVMSFFSAFRRAQTLRRGTFPIMFSQRTVQPGITLRRFATTPPPQKTKTALYTSLGVAAIGTFALFYFTDLGRETNTVAKSAAQTAKSASGFVPTKEDYQKVRFRQLLSEALFKRTPGL